MIKMQRETSALAPGAINAARRNFYQTVGVHDDFALQAVKAKSATQQFTEALTKNEITFNRLRKSGKVFNDVLREQYSLQRMTAIQWSKNASGLMRADVIVPKGVSAEVEHLTSSLKGNISALLTAKRGSAEFSTAAEVMKMRIGMANQALGSSAENLIKWGKNTQWAGRQLMVGLGVPFAAFAAVAGITAYHVNQELTRVAKVYDTTATTMTGKALELDKLRADSMRMGIQVANQYGATLKDTFSVEADLAATGLKNQQLLQATANVQRASLLGEMDKQQTVKATIALQSVYNLSTAQLTDAFNYMNATENATNLTMQDFVETIPRASGPLKQLGVTLQQTGVLMAAMKARGIDAAVGANALRSSVYRLLNPTPAATKMLDKFNISLDGIISRSKGNAYKALLDLSTQMKGLSNLDQQRIVGRLFGIQRAGQITAILQGLQDIHDKTTQVGRAYQIATQSTQQWANVAQGEIDQVRQSLSGRIKIAMASFNAELAQVGQVFLKMSLPIIKFASGLLHFFNSLPKGVKTFILFGAALGALAGVGIMITGVFANMVGQMMKGVQWLGSLGSKFKAMTTEQQAEKLLSEQNVLTWQNQGNAAMMLSKQLKDLTLSINALNQEQQIATRGYRIVSAPNGGVMRSNGQFASKDEIAAYQDAENKSKAMVNDTEAVKRDWGAIGSRVAGLGVGVGLMGAMVSNGNKLLSTITNVVFIASLLGPTLARGIKAAVARGAFGGLKGVFAAERMKGLVAPLVSSLKVVGETLLRFAGPIGLAAAGAGFMYFKIHGAQQKAAADQKKINESAKSWADILGYVYTQQAKITDATGKSAKNTDTILKAFADANPQTARYLESLGTANEELARQAAIQEGIKARMHGGSADQAKQAVNYSLQIEGFSGQALSDQLTKAMQEVDFSNAEAVAKKQIDGFSTDIQRMLKNDFSDPSAWEKIGSSFSGPGHIPFLRSGHGLSSAATQAAKGMADDFYNAFEAQNDPSKRLEMWRNVSKMLDNQIKNTTGDVQDRAKQIKTDFLREFKDYFPTGMGKYSDAFFGDTTKMGTIAEWLHLPMKTVAEAQNDLNKAMASGDEQYRHMSAAQKLVLLNMYRAQAGLPKATSLEQGFGNAVQSSTGKLKSHAQALQQAALGASDFTSALQQAMGGARDAVLSEADSVWSQYAQNSQNAIQATANAQKRAIDNAAKQRKADIRQQLNDLWKLYDGPNGKITKLNREIKAETAAEQKRQAAFDAEKARQQYLADQANKTIDFNVALDLGNFDQAAQIQNDMQNAQTQQALDAAQKKSQSASDAKIARMNRELDHLKKLDAAQKKALEAELTRYTKSTDGQKAAIDKKAQADQTANQNFLDNQKHLLDLQLLAIRASTPRNQREYNHQIAQIEAAYSQYGVNLQAQGDNWAGYVGAALQANVQAAAAGLRDKVNWTNIGNAVANRFTKGALGLTIGQFAKWVATGVLPKQGLNPHHTVHAATQTQYAPGVRRTDSPQTNHAGGAIAAGSSGGGEGRSPHHLRSNEVMVRAQKGEYVLSAATHRALGTDYLDSLNSGGSAPMGLVGAAGGLMGGMMAMAIGRQIASVAQAITGKGGPGGGPGYYGPVVAAPSSVQHWAPLVAKALRMLGLPADLVQGELALISHEGSSPTSVNRWDSNWKRGHPSVGLTQTIDSTYEAYAGPFKNKQPKLYGVSIDPLAQIYAGLNYANTNYGTGMIRAGGRHDANGNYIGYDKGGILQPGISPVFNGTQKPEVVFTDGQWSTLSKLASSAVSSIPQQRAAVDQNSGNHYTIEMNFEGANFATELDIEKAVTSALTKAERKRGPSRKVGS